MLLLLGGVASWLDPGACRQILYWVIQLVASQSCSGQTLEEQTIGSCAACQEGVQCCNRTLVGSPDGNRYMMVPDWNGLLLDCPIQTW